MDSHEEYRELCAAATAGELSANEEAKLDVHLAVCPECHRAMTEYGAAARKGAFAGRLAAAERETSFRDIAALNDLVNAILADASGKADPRAYVVPSIGTMSDRGGGDWRQRFGRQRFWNSNLDSRQSPMLGHGR